MSPNRTAEWGTGMRPPAIALLWGALAGGAAALVYTAMNAAQHVIWPDDIARWYIPLIVLAGGADLFINVIDGSISAVPDTMKTVKGVIDDIRSAVIGGNTLYYIRLEGGSVYYSISAAQSSSAVILSVGDSVEIQYEEADGAEIQGAYTIVRK